MKKIFFNFSLVIFFLFGISPVLSGQTMQKLSDGVVIVSPQSVHGIKKIKLTIWNANIIQVIASPTDTLSQRSSLILQHQSAPASVWNVTESDNHYIISTSAVTAKVEKTSLHITFFDHNGNLILAEDERSAQAAVVMGEACYSIKQAFQCTSGEALYGLGNFQNADMQLNGKKLTLLQKNREDVVPVILSTNHYGIIWDNYSYGEFNDTRGSYYLWSEVADEIQYFFLYGNTIDSIVSAYRMLTGQAPLYPKWVFGYMQSKQKYNTQAEVDSVVKGFRDRNFPLDLIVQDWMYWPNGQWGQKSFDRKNYPDPKKMVSDIHHLNTKIMISIWPNMTKGTPDQIELMHIHGLFADSEHVNILMPEARELYWRQVCDSLFSVGIDGFWADCSEGYDSDWSSPFFKLPELKLNTMNANEIKKIMNGGRYINVYALLHTKGLYEGWRSTQSQKRPFILTRSSFAGMQRYGASYWSGDVSANWEEFRMQIPAGLNYCMTGLPYWTTDIAGYFIKHQPGWWFSNGTFEKGQDDEGFHELYTRWFQFAAFCPLFRAHGADVPREPWAFGSPDSRTYQTLLKFTNLRYRLMPYIYSLAWKVSNENYTLMRALPFDFMNDSTVYSINDQYMFGPALMVNPVVRPLYYHYDNVQIKTTSYTRSVYLPGNTVWFDFWTGRHYTGGTTIAADASFETMPLFVRAGSILPMGPRIQYSTEQDDPLEIRIYPGADGAFTLYEDENDNFNYLKGMYALTGFHWDDRQKELTIDARRGSFPGMHQNHTFNIVLVNEAHGVDVTTSQHVDATVHYSGKEIVLHFSK
ncbi:MAG TPA: glycoside hydrolase family 31 protein [Bacteroidota bacterium]|nr:glycoside hydrolase family 31 protein [Bacteroidota bacterium]